MYGTQCAVHTSHRQECAGIKHCALLRCRPCVPAGSDDLSLCTLSIAVCLLPHVRGDPKAGSRSAGGCRGACAQGKAAPPDRFARRAGSKCHSRGSQRSLAVTELCPGGAVVCTRYPCPRRHRSHPSYYKARVCARAYMASASVLVRKPCATDPDRICAAAAYHHDWWSGLVR